MSHKDNKGSLVSVACTLCVLGLVLAVISFWYGPAPAEASSAVSSGSLFAAPSATFAANAGTLGAIPDGPGTPTLCGSDGAAKNVTFTVSGLSGSVSAVDVNMTFGAPVHTFVGDVTAILIAPNGASHTLFGYTGSTTAAGCGDSSDLAGPYTFSDTALTPPSGGWWQSATAAGAAAALATGSYRTTNKGGAGATNPQPPTTMNSSFTGVTNANGTWTLRLLDGGGGDTGSVSAATLNVTTASVATDAAVDFNGDSRSDYVVVRSAGGPSGQITWFINNSSGGGTQAYSWGLATDFFVAEDFDGDLKDDIAVWRPGTATNAAFYILNSNGFTVRTEAFGQTGDDPTVVGDYNNDGKADLAVYRAGASAGQASVWYYRTVANGPVSVVQWGLNGDAPAPGDYDGNGSSDFCVQRSNAGQGEFWLALNGPGTTSVTPFGTSTDVVVPGDYDGDGKTDIAVARGSGGSLIWYWRPSGGGVDQQVGFGIPTDYPTQGDYDGDGKTDQAIWRNGTFWVRNIATGAVSTFQLGSAGDYPVANFNAH